MVWDNYVDLDEAVACEQWIALCAGGPVHMDECGDEQAWKRHDICLDSKEWRGLRCFAK